MEIPTSASGLPNIYHGSNSLVRDSDNLCDRLGNGPIPTLENATLLVTEAYRQSDRSVLKLADLIQGKSVPQLTDPILKLRALSLIRGQVHLPEKAMVAIRCGLIRSCVHFQTSSTPEATRLQSALLLEMMLRLNEGRKTLLAVSSSGSNSTTESALRILARRAEEDESPSVRIALANALASFCTERSSAEEFVSGSQALAHIMRGLSNGSFCLLKPLIALTNATPIASQALLSALAPEAILSALTSLVETSNESLLESEQDLLVIDVLSLLRSICALDAGKEACFHAGLVPYATVLLQSSNSNIREISIGIVALMSTLLPAKRAFLSGDPHHYVLPYLNLLAFDAESSRLTTSTTVQAIRSLSEVADGRLAFLHALISDPQAIVRIYGASACSDLMHILDSKEASFDERSFALSAIGHVCKTVDIGLNKLADCIGVIPILMSISSASTSQSQSSERLRDLNNRIISSQMKSIATQLIVALGEKFQDMQSAIHKFKVV